MKLFFFPSFNTLIEYQLCPRACSWSWDILVYKRNKILSLRVYILVDCYITVFIICEDQGFSHSWGGTLAWVGRRDWIQVLGTVLTCWVSLSLSFLTCKIRKLNVLFFLLSINHTEWFVESSSSFVIYDTGSPEHFISARYLSWACNWWSVFVC